MASVTSCTGRRVRRPDAGWEICSTPAGQCAAPAELALHGNWLAAVVPGTVAGALRDAGQWSLDDPAPLHDRDFWYRVSLEGNGDQVLRFGGLATIAEVYLDGTLILSSDNMYVSHEVPVQLGGTHQLTICFRALWPALQLCKGPRARWRTQLASPAGLRFKRTTLLGHMNGWCPPVHAVGPWRAIELIEQDDVALIVAERSVRTALVGKRGTVTIALTLTRPVVEECGVEMVCAGKRQLMQWLSTNTLVGELHIDNVEMWWPHTHGLPKLYDIYVETQNCRVELGQVGFRNIEVVTAEDGAGFGLKINGQPVFCRGACWTPLDLVTLEAGPEKYRQILELVQRAGMNMLRLSGTCVYESDAFYKICDEMGILVWQDFMFANFDYPVADPSFLENVKTECTQFLNRIETSPCLAVLCGGSEVFQQSAMLGLPPIAQSSKLFDDLLAQIAKGMRPDVPYLPNSPFGGPLPFVADSGVSHYYSVGAYLRPLDDARRARVRFASECLAFSHVPERIATPLHDRRWKERVPRDTGVTWDFEDVRDHYLSSLYRVDAAQLRRFDPEQYIELSRSVVADIYESVFMEWRRVGSETRGALVWTLLDLWDGAGWGVIAADGTPKSAWFAMRRVLQPIYLGLTDEGVNGLRIHWHNETPIGIDAVLHFICLRDGTTAVRDVSSQLQLPSRSQGSINASELLNGFFDTTYAYRFGPPTHDSCIATLTNSVSGEILAQAIYFPLGHQAEQSAIQISSRLERAGEEWNLILLAGQLARRVHIVDDAFDPDDNWFHLVPGQEKRVTLHPRGVGNALPSGTIRAINSRLVTNYSVSG
jgi:beta-mannosidase